MASRRRLGAAVVLDPPLAHELDGLRRALADASRPRIAPHVTLVPPLNLAAADLGRALAVLRDAAASLPGPLRLSLGPVTSFLPANPVVLLGVGGELEALRRLRDRVFIPPLERSLSWPWVPHVTLADEASPERIGAAVSALAGYAAVAEVSRVVLLEEVHSGGARRWVELADANLGPRGVVGRGGLALELTRGRLIDPEAARLEGAAQVARTLDGGRVARIGAFPIVITARREGRVAGVGAAWLADGGGRVWVAVEEASRRQGVGSHLLAHLEAAVDGAGWDCETLGASGPAGFYRARSSRVVPLCGGHSKATDA